MSIFIIPDKIEVNVTIALDADLLALFQEIVDQRSDRAKAKALSVDVKTTTAAMQAAIPSP